MKIKGLSAIVTGAASGMGQVTARLLSKQGAKVFALDLNYDGVKKIAEEIGGIGLACDVTKEDSVIDCLSKISEPRICINCAGILSAHRLVGKEGPMKLDNFKNVIEVNLVGTFNVMRLVAEKMSKLEAITGNSDSERGIIINTASIAAFEGQLGQVSYSASKGGVVAMSLPAARELSKFGIRVVAIAPGLIETPMLTTATEKVQDNLKKQTIFPKRLGRSQEFAKLVVHIIDNPLINGEVIRLDGAVRLN